MKTPSAVHVAVALFKAPERAARLQAGALPADVLAVIRIAAGDRALAEACAPAFGLAVNALQEACAFYIQSVLFHPDSNHFRVLGASRDADQDTLKQHYRWLQKWLHPDRDPEGWSSVYSHRVNVAWDTLKRPERRAAYRATLPAERTLRAVGAGQPPPHPPHGVPSGAGGTLARSSKWIRRLPAVMAVITAAVAVGLWAAHRAGQDLLAAGAQRASIAPSVARSDVAQGAGQTQPATQPATAPVWPRSLSAVGGVGLAEPAAVEQRLAAPASTIAAAESTPSTVVAGAAPAPTPATVASVRPTSPRGARPPERAASIAATRPPSAAPAGAQSPAAAHALAGASAPTREVLRESAPAGDSAASSLVRAPTAMAAHAAAARAAVAPAPDATPPALAETAPMRPADARAPAPPLAPPAAAIASAEQLRAGARLLRAFSDAYRAGEVQRLVVLFKPNARTPAGNLLDLHGAYTALFAQSSRRSLEFLDIEWRPAERGIEGTGRYEWAMRPRNGSRMRAAGGQFRIVIEFDGARPLIARFEQQDVG